MNCEIKLMLFHIQYTGKCHFTLAKADNSTTSYSAARVLITVSPISSFLKRLNFTFVGLGGLEVRCSPLDPRFAGSNPA